MAIVIDNRYLRGPRAFYCHYIELYEKEEVYDWLVDNFKGKYPSLDYDHSGTNNGNWRVNDSYRFSNHKEGGFTVRFCDEEDAIAFKLRWT